MLNIQTAVASHTGRWTPAADNWPFSSFRTPQELLPQRLAMVRCQYSGLQGEVVDQVRGLVGICHVPTASFSFLPRIPVKCKQGTAEVLGELGDTSWISPSSPFNKLLAACHFFSLVRRVPSLRCKQVFAS